MTAEEIEKLAKEAGSKYASEFHIFMAAYEIGKAEGAREKAREILEHLEILHVESSGKFRTALEDLIHITQGLCQPQETEGEP